MTGLPRPVREKVLVEPRQGFTLGFEVAVLRRFVVCAGCGLRLRQREDYELDHIICRANGGKHIPENVEPLCLPCHAVKTAADKAAAAKAKRLAGETCTARRGPPIRSRSFDKTKSRGFDGRVKPRKVQP